LKIEKEGRAPASDLIPGQVKSARRRAKPALAVTSLGFFNFQFSIFNSISYGI
jgi:hypothetical protein